MRMYAMSGGDVPMFPGGFIDVHRGGPPPLHQSVDSYSQIPTPARVSPLPSPLIMQQGQPTGDPSKLGRGAEDVAFSNELPPAEQEDLSQQAQKEASYSPRDARGVNSEPPRGAEGSTAAEAAAAAAQKMNESDSVRIGGYFLWVKLPNWVHQGRPDQSSDQGAMSSADGLQWLRERARMELNLDFKLGSECSPRTDVDWGQDSSVYLRLCYARKSEAALEEGARRLCVLLSRIFNSFTKPNMFVAAAANGSKRHHPDKDHEMSMQYARKI